MAKEMESSQCKALQSGRHAIKTPFTLLAKERKEEKKDGRRFSRNKQAREQRLRGKRRTRASTWIPSGGVETVPYNVDEWATEVLCRVRDRWLQAHLDSSWRGRCVLFEWLLLFGVCTKSASSAGFFPALFTSIRSRRANAESVDDRAVDIR